MRIEMEKCGLATGRQLRPLPGDTLQDRAGDPVITADGHRPRARFGDAVEKRRDPLDAFFVVHGFGERNVAEVVDTAAFPRREIEMLVVAPIVRRDIADGARSQVLVAFRRSVAGAVGNADECDVAIARVGVVRGTKECRDAPPIERLEHHPVVGIECHAAAAAISRTPWVSRAALSFGRARTWAITRAMAGHRAWSTCSDGRAQTASMNK